MAGRRPLEPQQLARDRDVICSVLEVAPDRCVIKERLRQRGLAQYEKQATGGESFIVLERGLRFEVNLTDYLDTGLFLDHRETRRLVGEQSTGRRVLNLFAYTGSFTVYAAAGGAAQTVTVDLSHTYQSWCHRNLALNGLDDDERHSLIQADVLSWLAAARTRREQFDLIVLDPPSFSNSKRMRSSFDVQRDQGDLIARTVALLRPGGTLYFSTNRQGFRLAPPAQIAVSSEEITAQTVPPDFARSRPHRCWRMERMD